MWFVLVCPWNRVSLASLVAQVSVDFLVPRWVTALLLLLLNWRPNLTLDLFFSLCRELAESLEPLDSPASRDTEWVWRTFWSGRIHPFHLLLLMNPGCCLILCAGIQRSGWSQGRQWTSWSQGTVASHSPKTAKTVCSTLTLYLFSGRTWYQWRERRPRNHGMILLSQTVYQLMQMNW